MAGNYYQDLNSNPFNTGVQLHRTPPHNAGLADEQQPLIFTTQAQARCAGSDNPLRLGGYFPAPAITFPGERSQQPSSVQLHRTPQALTWSTTSTATHASVADEDMSNGMRTEVNDPLMLGGPVLASAMAFPGERSRQNLIFAPQVQAMPDPFCLSSMLSICGTQHSCPADRIRPCQ